MQEKKRPFGARSMAATSLLLLLLALAAVTAATVAWLSLSDYTRVHSMGLDVTTGVSLRFDLDSHEDIADYTQTLSMESIFARIRQEQGFDPWKTELDPVTTSDGQRFTSRNGTVQPAATGRYLTFTLHFMSSEDMLVHLTSAHSEDRRDGTLVLSEKAALPPSMRISFTINDATLVYDPGMGDRSQAQGTMRLFGLAQSDRMVYGSRNTLFRISAYTDTPVTVRIWLEGTDELCTNDLKGADYSVQLRFVGTDENHRPLGE